MQMSMKSNKFLTSKNMTNRQRELEKNASYLISGG